MFAQEACGCPVQPGLYPYRCYAHAVPRMQTENSHARGDWYRRETCGFCGRSNPGGLACATVERCDLCAVVSCDRHDMACYKLKIICPRLIRPRTKVGRAFLKALANWRF